MCKEYLNTQDKGQTFVLQVDFNKGVRFAKDLTKKCTLDEIYAVVYPQGLAVEAKAFWQHTGFGISSRRATYWLENAPFLNHASKSCTGHLPDEEASESKLEVQKRIADLFSTDTNTLDVDDVFLYPSGMSSISHTADTIRHLNTNGKATVAIFGYVDLEVGLGT